jgi:hypothetical protein
MERQCRIVFFATRMIVGVAAGGTNAGEPSPAPLPTPRFEVDIRVHVTDRQASAHVPARPRTIGSFGVQPGQWGRRHRGPRHRAQDRPRRTVYAPAPPATRVSSARPVATRGRVVPSDENSSALARMLWFVALLIATTFRTSCSSSRSSAFRCARPRTPLLMRRGYPSLMEYEVGPDSVPQAAQCLFCGTPSLPRLVRLLHHETSSTRSLGSGGARTDEKARTRAYSLGVVLGDPDRRVGRLRRRAGCGRSQGRHGCRSGRRRGSGSG